MLLSDDDLLGGGQPSGAAASARALDAPASPDSLTVSSAHLLFQGDYVRDGFDLVLSDGQDRLVIHDYFRPGHRPDLKSPEGAVLSGDVVEALSRSEHGPRYAQAGGAPAPQAIGRVETVTGSATAIRNGQTVVLNVGDIVYKGDTVQTDRGGTLAISFIDGTTFNLSSSARMVLNEMVYTPGGTGNASLLSLVQGSISFVAGNVAKTGDMRVDTPVATMGIRGTAVIVQISAENGTTEFSVVREPDGTVGSYVLLSKATGLVVATVSQNDLSYVISNPTAIPLAVFKDATQIGLETALIQRVDQIRADAARIPIVPPTAPGDRPTGDPNPNQRTDATPNGAPTDTTKTQGTPESKTAGNQGVGSSSSPTIVNTATSNQPSNGNQPNPDRPADTPIVVKDPTGAPGPPKSPLSDPSPTQPVPDVTVPKTAIPTAIETASSVVPLKPHLVLLNADQGIVVDKNDGVLARQEASPTVQASEHVKSAASQTQSGPMVTLPTDGGPAVVEGRYGVLKIYEDGSFSYAATTSTTALAAKALVDGEIGTDVFAFTEKGLTGDDQASTLTFRITGLNDAPVAQDDHHNAVVAPNETVHASTRAVGVLANDFDFDTGDTATLRVAQVSHTYPNGTIGFVSTPADPAPNPAPVNVTPNPNTYSLIITAPAEEPTGNGIIHGDYGTLTLRPDGTYDYTADANTQLGADDVVQDTFRYLVEDTHHTGAYATLTFDVKGVNDAPVAVDDSYEAVVGPSETVHVSTRSKGVLANDTDPDDGDAATLKVTSVVYTDAEGHQTTVDVPSGTTGASIHGAYGTLTLKADGTYDYTADLNAHLGANDVAHDSFQYIVADTHDATASATLTIDVGGVNDAPVAVDDVRHVTAGNPVSAPARGDNGTASVEDDGLLFNDSDPDDGDKAQLHVTSVQSLTPRSSSSQTYVLPATAAAYLTAGHTLVSGLGGSAGFGENLLPGNDDGSSSAIDITSIFGEGGLNFFGRSFTTLYVNNNGNLTFTAPSFAFTPTPINGSSDNPIIAALWYDVDTRSGPISGPGSNLVYWDLDADAKVFTVTWNDVGYYSFGTNHPNSFQLQLINEGEGNFDIVFRYQSVTYGGSTGARIGYSAGTSSTSYELPQSGNPFAIVDLDTLVGNTGIPGVDVYSVRNGLVVGQPVALANGSATLEGAYGTLTVNADGTYAYDPNHADALTLGQTKQDVFLLTVEDGHGGTATERVTFDVEGRNHAPVLSTAPVTLTGTNEDVTSAGQTVASFLAATDAEPGAPRGIAVTATSGDGTWQYSTDGVAWTAFGSLSASSALLLTDTTQIRYVPAPNSHDDPALTFRTWDRSDGAASTNLAPGHADTTTHGGSTAFSDDQATATLPVAPVSDVPTLAVVDASGNENSAIPLAIEAALTDPSEALSVTVSGVPSGAVLSAGIDNHDGSWSLTAAQLSGLAITPAADFVGTFGLSVTAISQDGSASPAQIGKTLTVTSLATNHAPVAVDDSGVVNSGASLKLNVLNNDSDPDNDALTVTAVTSPQHGMVVINADQTVTYTAASGYVGLDSFQYTASDGHGGLADATVALTVKAPQIATTPTLAVGSSNTLNPTDGSAIKTTLALHAGDVVSFDWNFVGHDYLPFNDFSFATVNGKTYLLGLTQAVGDYGSTGWKTFTYAAPDDGSYTIGIGEFNVNDTLLNSHTFVDNVRVNGASVTSFENGYGGFTTSGTTSIVSALTDSASGANNGVFVSPTNGTKMVLLDSAASTPATIESFLGLSSGAVSAVAKPSGNEFTPIVAPISVTVAANDHPDATYATIGGAPDGSVFNHGIYNTLDHTWKVDIADLAGNLTITTPSDYAGNFTLSVTATSVVTGNSTSATTTAQTIAVQVFGAPVNLIGTAGPDTLKGGAFADTLDGGPGQDILTGGAGNDIFVFRAGQSAGDTVTDFNGNGAGAGDEFRFVGFGTAAQGASFTQVDATHWQINSADGAHHEIIALQNAAAVHASDYHFV